MAISKMPQILRTYVLYCVHNIGIDLSHGWLCNQFCNLLCCIQSNVTTTSIYHMQHVGNQTKTHQENLNAADDIYL